MGSRWIIKSRTRRGRIKSRRRRRSRSSEVKHCIVYDSHSLYLLSGTLTSLYILILCLRKDEEEEQEGEEESKKVEEVKEDKKKEEEKMTQFCMHHIILFSIAKFQE